MFIRQVCETFVPLWPTVAAELAAFARARSGYRRLRDRVGEGVKGVCRAVHTRRHLQDVRKGGQDQPATNWNVLLNPTEESEASKTNM